MSFKEIQKRAGLFEYDLFASDWNHRVEKYFSKMPSDKAVGRDAFLASWGDLGNVFACPAPKDVSAVLKKFVRDGAKGGLLIPRWFSLYGWELLCHDGAHMNGLVSSMKIVWPKLEKGPYVVSDVFSGFTSFPFLSLKINGQASAPFVSKVKKAFCVKNGCEMCS